MSQAQNPKMCKVCGFPGPDVQSRATPRGQLDCHAACAGHLKEMAGTTPADAGTGVIFNKTPPA